jgi:putative transposase
MTNRSPFRYFKTSPEIIRLAVMLCIRFPLSLPNVDDLLHKRGIEISHETAGYWWNRFGPMFAVNIQKGLFGFVRILARNYQRPRVYSEREFVASASSSATYTCRKR